MKTFLLTLSIFFSLVAYSQSNSASSPLTSEEQVKEWLYNNVEYPEKAAEKKMYRDNIKLTIHFDKLGDFEEVKFKDHQNGCLFQSAIIKAADSLMPPVELKKKRLSIEYSFSEMIPKDKRSQYIPVDFSKRTSPKFLGNSEPSSPFNFWIYNNLKYPPKAIKNRIEGEVMLSFIISKTGWISKVILVSSPHDLLSEEAIRVVVASSPHWSPGINEYGDKVNVKYDFPIIFKLEERRYP